MKKNNVMFIARTAIVAALYVVLTLASYSFSYGAVQFRISEALVLLCYIDPFYIPGLVIGCFMANLFSPFGFWDVIFGTFSTVICTGMVTLTARYLKRNLFSLIIASLWSSVFSFLIAFEIVFICGAKESFLFWVLMVAIGEFVVITLFGVPLFQYMFKNDRLIAFLKFPRKSKTKT